MVFKRTGLFLLFFVVSAVSAVPTLQTGKTERKQVSLTIYERDVALVKDVRQVVIHKGKNRICFDEVSEQIQPGTVMLKSLSPDAIQVSQIDLNSRQLSPQTLLESHVGKTVRIIRTNPMTGVETEETGLVLSARDGGVLKVGDRIETRIPGRIVYDRVPAGLHDKPVLMADLVGKADGKQSLELDYLTHGISWRAHYVAQINDHADRMTLSGWATIGNNSGTDYRDAHVQLIAGKLNMTTIKPLGMTATIRSAFSDTGDANNPMSPESFAEYHLYTFPFKITLSNNQTRQYALLNANAVSVQKKWVVYGGSHYYRGRLSKGDMTLPVSIEMAFHNRRHEGLGMPLPGGTVRFYQADRRGNVQFLGESAMSHVSVDGDVSLKIGESFDVSASRKQTQFKMVPSHNASTKQYESAYDVTLKNAKDKSVTVQLKEPIPGNWQIVQETHPHIKEGSMAVWNINVPANGQVTLTYQVRVE